jgi:GDPmannose 4,6-dehydratase
MLTSGQEYRLLITGINGHLGSYLAEEYQNHKLTTIGTVRRSSTNTASRLEHLSRQPEIVEMELTDFHNVLQIVNNYKPHCIINTAAQSHVGTSFAEPQHTMAVNCGGVYNILEAIRLVSPKTIFIQMSTSEMFGSQYTMIKGNKYQNEETLMKPNSPYAIAKLAAHNAVDLYRRSYNVNGSCVIAFNYESERRGEQFVTRKITKWLGDLTFWSPWLNNQKLFFADDYIHADHGARFPKLRLGNLNAMRDWSHTLDTVRAIELVKQDLDRGHCGDYVVGTGETYTVQQFLEKAFKCIGIDNYEDYVVQDKSLYRPHDVPILRADASKIKRELGWTTQINFDDLVARMVSNDVKEERFRRS